MQACSEGFNPHFQKEQFLYLAWIKNSWHCKLSIISCNVDNFCSIINETFDMVQQEEILVLETHVIHDLGSHVHFQITKVTFTRGRLNICRPIKRSLRHCVYTGPVSQVNDMRNASNLLQAKVASFSLPLTQPSRSANVTNWPVNGKEVK